MNQADIEYYLNRGAKHTLTLLLEKWRDPDDGFNRHLVEQLLADAILKIELGQTWKELDQPWWR
jgi:hypothetical protein